MKETLKISEIFYSLQGEGARAGEPSIFVRLQGCSAKHACYASGVECDTEFESGVELTLDDLHDNMLARQFSTFHPEEEPVLQMLQKHCRWIVWTGGEPLDQLTPDILQFFREHGYQNAIETSGIRYMTQDMADSLEHIVVSPKVAEHVLSKNFSHLRELHGRRKLDWNIDELRYVRHAGQYGVPEPVLKAQYYYLSPHTDGAEINIANLRHCIKLCMENPRWRLSVQQHKLWKIL